MLLCLKNVAHAEVEMDLLKCMYVLNLKCSSPVLFTLINQHREWEYPEPTRSHTGLTMGWFSSTQPETARLPTDGLAPSSKNTRGNRNSHYWHPERGFWHIFLACFMKQQREQWFSVGSGGSLLLPLTSLPWLQACPVFPDKQLNFQSLPLNIFCPLLLVDRVTPQG